MKEEADLNTGPWGNRTCQGPGAEVSLVSWKPTK